MKKIVEVHVMASQAAFARGEVSWDAAFQDVFSYVGDGVWRSRIFRTRYEEDVMEMNDLKAFAEERMASYGVTEFYVEIVDIND